MKPSWRGVLHGYSLLLVVPLLAFFLLTKADTPTVSPPPTHLLPPFGWIRMDRDSNHPPSHTQEHLAASLFALCCLLLFLSSWAYHRVHWSPKWEVYMQKLDHCMIFIMVAGNVVPLSLLALHKTRLWVLTLSCLVAAFGMIQIFRSQKNLIHFVLTGSVMVIGLKELVSHLTPFELTLIVSSWCQYALGMVIYARGNPPTHPPTHPFQPHYQPIAFINQDSRMLLSTHPPTHPPTLSFRLAKAVAQPLLLPRAHAHPHRLCCCNCWCGDAFFVGSV